MKFNQLVSHVLTALFAVTTVACQSGSGSGHNGNADDSAQSINVTITGPSGARFLETRDPSVVLSGTAHSDVAITSVSWSSSRGMRGTASGTEFWQTPAIPLEIGENELSVVAEDASGATAIQTVVIKRETAGDESVSLNWLAPTSRTDGSPLTNLAGYRIYYGRSTGDYDFEVDIDNPGIQAYVVENLSAGLWFFAMAAYDTQGLQSDRSGEIRLEIG